MSSKSSDIFVAVVTVAGERLEDSVENGGEGVRDNEDDGEEGSEEIAEQEDSDEAEGDEYDSEMGSEDDGEDLLPSEDTGTKGKGKKES